MRNLPPKPFDNQRVEEYKQFDKISFSWQYIEAPAFIDHTSRQLVDANIVALDLGCGTGRVGNRLIQNGLSADKLYGIDVSESMVLEAQKRVPAAHFVAGSVAKLPFENNKFDLVVSNVLLHLMDSGELRETLEEVSRVLKSGASYFCVESNPYQDSDNPRLNEWVTTLTPWGADISVFRHDYRKVLEESAEITGLYCKMIYFPGVQEAGQGHNQADYERYTNKDLRIGMLLQKQ